MFIFSAVLTLLMLSLPLDLAADSARRRSAGVAGRLARYLGEAVMEGFSDDDVTDVYVNPHDRRVRFDTHSQGKVDTGHELSEASAEQFLNAVADLHGLVLGRDHPALQAELPGERFGGARLQGFLPPTALGASFVARKLPGRVRSLEEYASEGTLSASQMELLRRAIISRWNVLIVGGTGTGKTTLTGALLKEIAALCPRDRVIVLEDTRELTCGATDHLALRTSEPAGLSDLVRQTLRAYPDRIVVGEVRGVEALDLLDAWSTGHPGGLGTVHARSAEGALVRLDRLCQRAGVPPQRDLVAEAVDLVVLMESGPGGQRRVKDLVRVLGLSTDGRFRLARLPADAPGEGSTGTGQHGRPGGRHPYGGDPGGEGGSFSAAHIVLEPHAAPA